MVWKPYSAPPMNYMSALLAAGKAVNAIRPYMKSYRQRNVYLRRRVRRKAVVRRAVGYAKTSRRPYKRKAKPRSLGKRITKLAKQVDQTTGNMTYRQFASAKLTTLANQQGDLYYSQINTGNLETVLAQLKFFNPAIPGTLTTASGAQGTYQRNVQFKSITQTMTVRNSYQTGCSVRIYLCQVKDDTNTAPSTAWQNGLTDAVYGVTVPEDIGSLPTDVQLCTDLWSLKIMKRTHLKPGQACDVTHTCKPFEYDSATVDAHALSYQREYGRSFGYLLIIQGDVGHDTAVTTEQTAVPAGVDVTLKTTFKVQYSAGINIKYVYVDNTMDSAFTNGGVVGNLVTDNQAFSVS